MDIKDILEDIEDRYDDTLDREPMRCGPHEGDWK